MAGALAAVRLAVVLVVSCGILLESSLQAPIPVERLHAAAVVVQAATTISGSKGEGNVSVSLDERTRLPASEADRIRTLPGVATVVADRSVYAPVVDRHGRLLKGGNGSPSVGHGWESAVLAPTYSRAAMRRRVGRTSSSTRSSQHTGRSSSAISCTSSPPPDERPTPFPGSPARRPPTTCRSKRPSSSAPTSPLS
jgi:hypothetical protein